MSWTRSSFCGNAACIDVCRQGQIVLVRDSAGTVQAWSAREWGELLRCIKVDWRDGFFEFADDCVDLGLERHDDKLMFTGEEWDAFKKGVVAEQFEIDKLREFKELSSPAAETGMSPAPGRTVGPVTGQTPSRIGARHGHDPSANPVSRDLPEDQANHAAAGAERSSSPPAPVAAQTFPPPVGCYCAAPGCWQYPCRSISVATSTNVPAGRIVDPPSAELPREASQPGLTNLQRVHAVVESQIRLGGSKTEIAEAIVADLQKGGLIVDDPAVETQETGS